MLPSVWFWLQWHLLEMQGYASCNIIQHSARIVGFSARTVCFFEKLGPEHKLSLRLLAAQTPPSWTCGSWTCTGTRSSRAGKYIINPPVSSPLLYKLCPVTFFYTSLCTKWGLVYLLFYSAAVPWTQTGIMPHVAMSFGCLAAVALQPGCHSIPYASPVFRRVQGP